ncbi:MAG: flagellar hook-length control protein FliK, partial [Deltaproteobacteria bacterium]|nr:flagellar hook-length control protein FliK [Deltaproteobacteria bacterium]
NGEENSELSTPLEFSAHGEEETSSSVLPSTVDPGETDVDTVGEREVLSDVKREVSPYIKSLQPKGQGAEGDDVLNVEGRNGVSEEDGVNELTQEGDEEKVLFKELGKIVGDEQKPSTANNPSLHSLHESENDDKGEMEGEHSIDEAIDDGGDDGEGGQRSESLPAASQRSSSGEGALNGQPSSGLEKVPAVDSLLQGQELEISNDEQTGEVKEASTVLRRGGAATPSHTLGRMVIDQVGSKIGLFFRDGIGKASIRLDPPSLGRLQIEIVVRDSVVRAQIAAEHQTVKEVLEQNLATLKEALTKQGLYVDEITVSLGEGGNEKRGGMEWGEHRAMEAGVRAHYNQREGEGIPSARGLSIHQDTTGVDIYI